MTEMQLLPANQIPARFYRGGARIDGFRGVPVGEDYRPEDWVGSTTALAGETALGLSALTDGAVLIDAITADPVGWLGPAHVDAFGSSTMMLVKLLDAGQRLPVHAHPDDEFARRRLEREHGKAEAWYILTPGVVHLGLTRSVTDDELAEYVDGQDVGTLLGALHVRTVRQGDTVFVPPGELHAIGDGILLLEIQQPEDLSILLEWDGFRIDGAKDGHLGLGFDDALQAVTTHSRTDAEVDGWIVRGPTEGSVLAPSAASFFRMERVVVDGTTRLERGFAVVVVENGAVTLTAERGEPLTAPRGSTLVVPYDAGDLRVTGDGSILICRPPMAPTVAATP